MWSLPFAQPTLTERALSYLPFTAQPTHLDRFTSLLLSPLHVARSSAELFRTLPALSLLVPFFTSYSTSLNLLFFYLTWSTLILSNSPLKVEIIGTFAIRIFFYVLPALGFYAFDAAVPSLAAGVKEHGEVALVLSEEHGGKKGGRWWRVPGVSVGNVLLGVVLQSGIEYLCTEVLRVRSILKVTTALPMPWGIFVDLLRGFILREVLTYTIHVYLHNPHFPPSKYHAKTYHSLPALYSFTAHYDHPIPYLLLRWLPTYLPALLWRFHLLTYFLYLSVISLEETFAYSGYNVLPSAFIVGGMARRHEIHLMGGGEGNFGCYGVCDFVMGTSLGRDVLDDAKEEAEQKNVAAKGKGKGKGAARKRRGGRE